MTGKADDALRTIGELSNELGVPQHILRYWESRFAQLRPLTRAGGRRYYRPSDVALARRIDQALNRDGYTIKGVIKMLADGQGIPVGDSMSAASAVVAPVRQDVLPALIRIRNDLRAALAA